MGLRPRTPQFRKRKLRSINGYRIYKTPFAATGDKEALATADQPDGKVSLQEGWTPDYELPTTTRTIAPLVERR